MPPVIIIGAGPTGLSLAVQLLRYNIDFIILEKNERTTHLSKAIVIQARTLEIFHESGLSSRRFSQMFSQITLINPDNLMSSCKNLRDLRFKSAQISGKPLCVSTKTLRRSLP